MTKDNLCKVLAYCIVLILFLITGCEKNEENKPNPVIEKVTQKEEEEPPENNKEANEEQPASEEKQKEESKFGIILDMLPDGNILVNSEIFEPKDLYSTLRKICLEGQVTFIGPKKIRSEQDILIKTDKDDRYGRIAGLLTVISKTGSYRIHYIHPDANKGEIVKLWLPILSPEEQQAPIPNFSRSLRELRIKLLWVNKENPEEKLYADDDPAGDKGMIILKIKGAILNDEEGKKSDEILLMQGANPYYSKLGKILKVNVEKFEAHEKCPSLPITIDPMAKIPFEVVLECIRTCQESGVTDICLAPPDDFFNK